MTASSIRFKCLRKLRSVLLSVFVLGLACSSAFAEKRVALVIGNSAYQNANRLSSPASNSDAISAMLKDAGFDVVDLKRDLKANEMRRALRDFSYHTREADIAIVYFAGHGIEIDGTNYLIPVDAALERDIDAYDEAISLDRFLTVIEAATQLRLVILDACRDNPFNRTMKRTIGSRAVGRGLAKVEPASPNTLIAYAAKAGSNALDDDSRNSPFTAALVKYLPRPGLDLRKAFGFTRDEVLKATKNRQEPFVYGSLGGDDVPLIAGASRPAPSVVAPGAPLGTAVAAPADMEAAIRRTYELALQVGSLEVWDSFITNYPNGFYTDLAKAQRRKLAAEEARRAEAERVKTALEARAAEAERVKAVAQAKAAEDARIAAEQAAARIKAVEDARAAEQARIAAERKAREEAKAAEAERVRAAAQAKAAEDARVAAEKTAARIKAADDAKAEQLRIAAERKAREDAMAGEAERVKAAAQAKAAEDAKMAAEKAAARIKAAEEARAAEQARIAAENKAREDSKAAEAERARMAKQAKADEDIRIAAAKAAQSEADARMAAEKAKQGEQVGQLAALTPPAQRGDATVNRDKPPAENISRLLQTELRRVGCNIGAVDGNWNATAHGALALFNKNAGTNLDVKVASLDALDVVRSKPARICPLMCEDGYKADGERCIRITCRAGYELGDDNTCERIKVKKPAKREVPALAAKPAPARPVVERPAERKTATSSEAIYAQCRVMASAKYATKRKLFNAMERCAINDGRL